MIEYCRINGELVGKLAMRGYPLAQSLMAAYMACRHHEFTSDRRLYKQLTDTLIGYTDEFIAHTLSLDTRAELRAKYGVFEEDVADLKGTEGLKL